jgi:PAS domain S-box-containing protein
MIPEDEKGDYTRLRAVADDFRFLSDLAIDLFQKSPDAVVVVSGEDGIIRLVNDQAELLTGYHHSELRGQILEKLVPASLREQHAAERARYIVHPHIRRIHERPNLRLLTKSGREIDVDIMLAPVSTIRGIYIIATVRRNT